VTLTHAGGLPVNVTQIEVQVNTSTGVIFNPTSCSMNPDQGGCDPFNPGSPIFWVGNVELSSANPTFTLTIVGTFVGTPPGPVQGCIDQVLVTNTGSGSPVTGPQQCITVNP
jgi:hypothetical protein